MQIILLLIGTGILFLAISGSFRVINNLLEGYLSQSWGSVNGKVISSTINSSKTKNGYSYTPEVVYEYSVVQNVYTNRTIAFYFQSTDSNNAGARVSKYLTGSHVKVFYNPNSPSISCLEPGFFLWENLGGLDNLHFYGRNRFRVSCHFVLRICGKKLAFRSKINQNLVWQLFA